MVWGGGNKRHRKFRPLYSPGSVSQGWEKSSKGYGKFTPLSPTLPPKISTTRVAGRERREYEV